MALTQATTGLTPQQWSDKFYVEHVQQNRFAGEMGTSENAIIQVNEDLTKKFGDSITFALVNRHTDASIDGRDTLEGFEEEQDARSFRLTVTQRRHAVLVSDYDRQLSAIDLLKAAKTGNKTWAMENTRDRIITALGSINSVAYGTATETQKDAWLVDNADRVLFGALKSNNSSNDHSASLANIDNTTDQLTSGAASLMKRIARSSAPKIGPVMSSTSGRFFYTMYVPSLVFRDLKTDSVITQAQRDVGLRMQNEKLFKGGDIEWDGIIFKEIEDIGVLSGVGATSIDVAPVYLCGRQAVGYGVAKRWSNIEQVKDYGDKKGVGVKEFGNFGKMTFGTGSGDTDDLKDHGIVTGFFASVADS